MKRLIISFFLIIFIGLFFFLLYNQNKIKEYEKTYSYFEGINIKLYTNKNCNKIFDKIEDILINYDKNKLLEYGISVNSKTKGFVNIYKGSIQNIYKDSKIKSVKPIYKDNNEISYDLIIKSYLINEIKEYLEKNKIYSYLINMKDNYLLGDSKGRKFTFALEKPFTDDYLLFLDLNNTAISTVGPYLNYYVTDNNLYHNLINPNTLKQENNYKSVTVITESPLDAQMLANYLYFLSIEDGKKILDKYNAEAIWYTNDDKLEKYLKK